MSRIIRHKVLNYVILILWTIICLGGGSYLLAYEAAKHSAAMFMAPLMLILVIFLHQVGINILVYLLKEKK